ncbi:MAG: trigger factor [Desulfovibrio sp.]|nr:trigger factor [Desulfovibrio sp.]
MNYSLEDVSPVVKKISITVPGAEVNGAIAGAIATYRDSVQIPGFRKGHVPASVIEQRYGKKVYAEAQENLVNVHINTILGETGLKPIGGLQTDIEPDSFKRDQDFSYSFTFEILPVFDLPKYEGLSVEMPAVTVTEEAVDEMLEHLRRGQGKLTPAEGDGPGEDGQIVNIDFSSADEDGNPLDIKATNFDLPLGKKQALPEFEALVKTVRPGEEKSGPVTFPEDFLNKDLAGKTVSMTVRVNAVKNLVLPELTDEFAQQSGVDSLATLRSKMREAREKVLNDMNRESAQNKLVGDLLKVVDFPLPPSILNFYIKIGLQERERLLQQHGKSLDALGKTQEELTNECRPEAELQTRSLVLLNAIAEKEGLDVTETEVQQAIYADAQRMKTDYNALREYCIQTGLIFFIRDRVRADKAAKLIFSRAAVTEVPAKADGQDTSAEAKDETKPAGE